MWVPHHRKRRGYQRERERDRETEKEGKREAARGEERLSIRERETMRVGERETLMALERRAEERKWPRLGSAAFVPGCAAWYEQSTDGSREGLCIAE